MQLELDLEEEQPVLEIRAGEHDAVSPLGLSFLVINILVERFGAEVIEADVRSPNEGRIWLRLRQPEDAGHD